LFRGFVYQTLNNARWYLTLWFEVIMMYTKGVGHGYAGTSENIRQRGRIVNGDRTFLEEGHEATSIAEFCDSIGIEAPSLYSAFGSKEELFCECLDDYQQTIAPLIWDGLDTERTAKDGFASVLYGTAKAFPSTIRASGCMVTLSAAGEDGDTPLGKKIKALRERV
jgi:AcrR family transcriptional regulator